MFKSQAVRILLQCSLLVLPMYASALPVAVDGGSVDTSNTASNSNNQDLVVPPNQVIYGPDYEYEPEYIEDPLVVDGYWNENAEHVVNQNEQHDEQQYEEHRQNTEQERAQMDRDQAVFRNGSGGGTFHGGGGGRR